MWTANSGVALKHIAFAAPPLSAPGGLARRSCGDASVHDMSVTSFRNPSRPNNMARHRTLRRALASASAKMPRGWSDGVRCTGSLSLCGLSLSRSINSRILSRFGGLFTQESCHDFFLRKKKSDCFYNSRPYSTRRVLVTERFRTEFTQF